MNKKVVNDSRLEKDSRAENPKKETTRAKQLGVSHPESFNVDHVLLENLHEVVFTLDLQGRFTYINPIIEKFTGYRVDQIIGKSFECFIYQEDLPGLMESFNLALLGKSRASEFRVLDGGGNIHHVITSSYLIQENGEMVGLSGVMMEITGQKQAELALLETEAKYHKLVEQIPAAVYTDAVDEQSTTLYISPQIEKLSGYTPGEWIADPTLWENIIHPEDRERVLIKHQETNRTGESFLIEYRLVTQDGQTVWVRDEATLLYDSKGKPLCWQGIMLDISERKTVEAALKESEEKYRNVVERAIDGIAIIQEGILKYVNLSLAQMTGWSTDEMIGTSLSNHIYPGDLPRGLDHYARRMAGEDLPSSYEISLQHKDKHRIYVELNTGIIQYNGEIADLVMVRDITERKLAEAALSQSETSYRDLFNRVSDAIFIQDSHNRFLDVNEGAVRMYGYSRDNLIGKRLVDIGAQGKNDIKKINRMVTEAIKDKPQQFEFWGVRSNGDMFPMEVRLYKGAYLGDAVVILLVRDITQRQHTEESLKRQLEELTVLHNVSMIAASTANIDQLIEQVTLVIGESIYIDDFGVALFDQTHQALIPHPSYRGETFTTKTEIPLSEGIIGHVASTGESYRAVDVHTDPYFLKTVPATLSELCVPIKIGEKLVGVINAESHQLNFFSEDDERLMTTIAGTLATTIERIQLFDAERARRQEAEALRQVTQVVTTSLDVNEVVRLMLDQLKNLFSFDTASVLLMGESGKPTLVAGVNFINENLTSQAVGELLKDSPILKQMVQDLKPLIIADVREYPSWIWVPGAEHVRSFLGVPLVSRLRVIGVLMADSVNISFFSEDNVRVALLLAQQMAIILENAFLYQNALEAAERRVILHRVSQDMVTAIQEPEKTYLSIHQATRQLMPCDSFVIALHDDVSNDNAIVYALEGNHRFPVQHAPSGRGLTGKVIKSGKSIIIDDMLKDKIDVIRMGEPQPVRSLVAVPLRLGQRTTGMISAQSYNIHAFDQEDQDLLETLASYAAVAIENARLYRDAVRATDRRSILHEVSQEIVKVGLDLERVYEAVHHAAEHLMPAETFVLSMLDEIHHEILSVYLYDEGKRWPPIHAPIGSGISGKVIATGKALIYNDLKSTSLPEAIDFGEGEQVRSLLAVPLRLGSKVFGMLSVQSYHPYAYTEEDQALLEMLSTHAAVAIENTRLYEAEQRRLQESETLREAAVVVTSTLDQNRAVQLILDQLARVVSYDSASVSLMRNGYLEIIGGQGWADPSAVLGLQIPIPGDNPNTLVIQQRSPVVLGNAPEKYSFFRQIPHNHIISWVGVPMIARDSVIGLLAIDSKQPNHFTQEDVRLISAFAGQAATAIENARLYKEALQAAESRAILHRASQEIAQANQDPEQVYMAVHRAAEQLMPAEAFVITLLDEQNQETVGVYLVDKAGRWQVERTPASVGLSGLVTSTGKSVVTNDLLVDDITGSIHFGTEEEEVRSILAVPLRLGEKVTGMLSVQSYQPNAYTDDARTLLELLAAHAAVAIENARLYAETFRRLKELEAVNRVSTALRTAQTVDDMLPTLLNETLQVLESEAGSIWLYDPVAGMLKEKAVRGWFAAVNETPVNAEEGISGNVFKTGQVHISREFATDPFTRESIRGQMQPGWGGAAVPIRTVRETIGVMFVSVELPRQLQPDAIHLLVTISEMAGNAIRRADLNAQTVHQLQRLASLRAIDMAINTILDLRVTLNILIDHVRSQLSVDAVDILLINQNTQTLYQAASSGFRSDVNKDTRLYIGDNLAGQAIRSRTTVHISHLSDNKQLHRSYLLTEENFVTYFGIPLIAKGQVKGVMETFHRSLLEPDLEWKNFLEALGAQAAIAIDNSVLFEELQQTNLNLSLAYDATIEGWSKALDMRDQGTEGHSLRVSEMTVQLATSMGIGPSDMVHIRRGALLHDIGKMGVPDSILHKPGPLTDDEWAIMRRHPEFAYDMISPITYLRQAIDIPYAHHERWDGSGYPRHLTGEQIPLAARIFAVVDVWDALTSDRPYRKAYTKSMAADYIQTNSGKLFDPQVVRTFLKLIENNLTS
jgi:PAS domain S-box-containing protein/putative nucleotidyltransferase with HDIG domain